MATSHLHAASSGQTDGTMQALVPAQGTQTSAGGQTVALMQELMKKSVVATQESAQGTLQELPELLRETRECIVGLSQQFQALNERVAIQEHGMRVTKDLEEKAVRLAEKTAKTILEHREFQAASSSDASAESSAQADTKTPMGVMMEYIRRVNVEKKELKQSLAQQEERIAQQAERIAQLEQELAELKAEKEGK